MTNGIHRIRYLFLIYSDKISPGTAKYIPHINTETSFFTAYMSNRFFLAKTMQIIKKKKYEITIINPDITRLEKYLPKELPLGKILGKVRLVDCIKMSPEFKEELLKENRDKIR